MLISPGNPFHSSMPDGGLQNKIKCKAESSHPLDAKSGKDQPLDCR
jgi:hypothetical protein